jgi:hypothetical protein
MCGRFTSSQRREVIAERFEVEVPESYSMREDEQTPQTAEHEAVEPWPGQP